MGFLEFLVIVFLVCAFAWGAVWLITYLFSPPAIVPKVIWGVAIFIILVVLARAVGLMGHDVQIPKLF